jgi:hypothetical protein
MRRCNRIVGHLKGVSVSGNEVMNRRWFRRMSQLPMKANHCHKEGYGARWGELLR